MQASDPVRIPRIGLLVVAATAVLLLAICHLSASAAFVPNRGQADSSLRFLAVGGPVQCGFTADGLVIALREPGIGDDPVGAGGRSPGDPSLADARDLRSVERSRRGWIVKVRFVRGNTTTVVEGERESSARFNFLLGNDPSGWRADLPAFEAVTYRDLWPGVDLRFATSEMGLVYEVSSRSGAQMPADAFRVEGASSIVEAADGSIRIETPVGSVNLTRSVDVPPSEPRDDPSTLAWSTFLGGSGNDQGWNLTLDGASNPVVAGFCDSPIFPVTPGAFDETANGGPDVFVAKIAPAGDALIWCTLIGGNDEELPFEIVPDPAGSGDLFLAGKTLSTDFPTTPGAYDRTVVYADAFLLRLARDGDALRWSTVFGGSDYDRAGGLAVDPSGVPTIGGFTYSYDLPTTPGAYDRTFNGGDLPADAFVARFSADGSSLIWSTYLGGAVSWDYVEGVALDEAGNVIVGGPTMSSDFPTTPGAFDTSYNGGGWDAYVAKLSSSGSDLIWSTFLGGHYFDLITALAREPVSGDILVTGQTQSSEFPTTPGAYDRTLGGSSDAFVTRLAPDGASLVWSTFVGGSDWEEGEGICLGAPSGVWLTGGSASNNFPTTPDAYDRSANGRQDAFVARLSSDGSTLLWGSYFGGSQEDSGDGIVAASNGHTYVAGMTASSEFPTTAGAFDTSHNGSNDAFAASLNVGIVETPCFYLDFDDDGDPYTIRTDLPEGTLSAPVRFVLEVPHDSPRGEAFEIRITEDCCDDSLRIGHYGVRLDHESVVFEPTIVDSYYISVPGDPSCAPWSIAGRFAYTPLPPPGNRIFFGRGEVEVLCEESPPCDLTHDLRADFQVPSGSSCEQNGVEMRTVCGTADVESGSIGNGGAEGVVTLSAPVPSPARRTVRVDLGLARPAHVLLQAFDATGRRVAVLADRSFGAGRTAIRWEPEGLPRGVYFLRVEALGLCRSRMVVVGR